MVFKLDIKEADLRRCEEGEVVKEFHLTQSEK